MNAKILVVDDMPENIQIISTCLVNSGYDVEFTQNGYDAIKWVEETNFDLILLDVMMPGMNGYEVCRRIKKLEGKDSIPVIFLTARTDIESISKGFDSGGVDYLTKPFFEKELLARVATHITIRLQKSELAYQNSFKNILMSVIAHDIRTPLSIISNMIGVVKIKKEQNKINEIGDALEIIDTSVNESFHMVNDLLIWGKVQFEKIQVNNTSINLFTIINEILILFSSVSKEKNIKISNFIRPDIFIVTDREMLKVILRNLLINAIRFTPVNGEILVNYEISGRKSCSIIIKDSGIGIDKDKLKDLFSTDKKNIPVNSFKSSGVGLGLFLCKDITEYIGGSISVESEKGKGSTFKISFNNLHANN